MNLVVQGARIAPAILQALNDYTRPSRTEELASGACRLHDAQPHPQLEALCAQAGLDFTWVEPGRRLCDFGLFVTDMDSTLINIECIDEIADMQGLKAEVAAITEASMRGEIDFGESLVRRVSLLAGVPEAALDEIYHERLRLNPGAERLLHTLQASGLHTVLVSGGFTHFTDRLRTRLGFDEAWANRLEVVDGVLTGRIVGDMVDAAAKAAHLTRIRDRLGLRPEQVIAAGDGANDIPMLRAAGFGVAYRGKPVLQQLADCRLNHSGLDGILNLFE